MLAVGTRHVAIELGDWVVIPGHYHFSVKFIFDRLSVPMAILPYVLSGTIGAWPDEHSSVLPQQAFLVGALLLIAAAGKSGLVPFSGWLPRAMEGPTPSSAVFYGALSVHLGAFLLLRVSPLLELSVPLCAMVVVLGLLTAVLAHLAGTVQTDIKSALSYASLTQVGIIVAEIGIGLRYIALIHLLGHACLRTLQ